MKIHGSRNPRTLVLGEVRNVEVVQVQIEGPELGNMLFGHSYGEFPIERSQGFEEELCRLFKAYGNTNDESYPDEFENGTFSVSPYWWGDCTCGYGEEASKWEGEHSHTKDCFNTRYLAEEERLIELHKIEAWNKIQDLMTEWAKNNGCVDAPAGMAVYCTCLVEREWKEFVATHSHKTDCMSERPNFLYKPTNFEIRWYKYPMRDSYMSQKITLDEFRKIIDACIDSLT